MNGQTIRYLYDITAGVPQLLGELDDSGNILRKYINEGSTVIGSVYGAGNEQYYLYDGLGSVIAVSNALGEIVGTYDYDAFGDMRLETGNVSNDLKFTGEQLDSETGLIYLRSRYYDPTTSRFITKDSFAGFISDPRSLNRYAYAYNNPVNLVDPSGHSPLEKTGPNLLDKLQGTSYGLVGPMLTEEEAKMLDQVIGINSSIKIVGKVGSTLLKGTGQASKYAVGLLMI